MNFTFSVFPGSTVAFASDSCQRHAVPHPSASDDSHTRTTCAGDADGTEHRSVVELPGVHARSRSVRWFGLPTNVVRIALERALAQDVVGIDSPLVSEKAATVCPSTATVYSKAA